MNRNFKILLAGASLAAMVSPLVAAPAAAKDEQSGAPQASTEVEAGDIIVSARRRDERLQDVPLTVSAVQAESLSKLQVRNFSDVASLVPGLTLTPAADSIAPSATLRGVNYDVNGSGSNGTVDFYLNDAPIPAGQLFQSMFDVGQIEVLHGPQGTLRGLASPSGSVTVSTTRPDLNHVGGYVNGTVTSIGGQNVNGAVNLPIIKGMLAVRIAGIYDNNEANRVHSKNDPSLDPFNRTNGERITVRFDPVDNLDIQGSYQHLVVKSAYFNQVESAALATGGTVVDTRITAADRMAVESTPRRIHQGYDVFRLQAEWKFAGQKVNYVGGWNKQRIISQYTGDEGAALIDLPGTYPGNANADPLTSANIYNYGQYTDSISKSYSHELRLSSDERLFGMVDYVLGGLINHQTAPTDLTIQTPVFGGVPSPATYLLIGPFQTSIRNSSDEKSLFGNVNVHIGDKTEISGGLRYIHFDNWSSLSTSTVRKTVDGFNGGEDVFNTTVYSGSIKHRFTDDIMVYASTGSSWRIGSGSTGIILASSGQLITPTDPNLLALYGFTPEKSKSYEVGVKTQWLDKRLVINLDYFHQTFDNFISTTPAVFFNAESAVGVASGNYTRSGLTVGVPAKVDGVEGEISFHANSHFNLGATFAYNKAKIVNGKVPCTVYDAAGNPTLPALPAQVNVCTANYAAGYNSPFTAAVQGEYTQPVGAYDGFARGLVSFYGNSQNQPTNPYDDIKAYAIVNAYLGLRDRNGGWELSAYVKNMFNTLRATQRDQGALVTPYAIGRTPGVAVSNYRYIVTTPPREFGLNLRVSFGSH